MGTNWLNVGKPIDVSAHSNPEECCEHKPRCISDKAWGVPHACPECQYALDYHVNPERTETKCSNEDFPSTWDTTTPNEMSICPQKITPAPTPAPGVEGAAAAVDTLKADIAALNATITKKEAEVEAKEKECADLADGDEKTECLKKLEAMKTDLAKQKQLLEEKKGQLAEADKALIAAQANATANGTTANGTTETKVQQGSASYAVSFQVGIMTLVAWALPFMSLW